MRHNVPLFGRIDGNQRVAVVVEVMVSSAGARVVHGRHQVGPLRIGVKELSDVFAGVANAQKSIFVIVVIGNAEPVAFGRVAQQAHVVVVQVGFSPFRHEPACVVTVQLNVGHLKSRVQPACKRNDCSLTRDILVFF